MSDSKEILKILAAVVVLVVAATVAGYHDREGLRDFAAFLVFVGVGYYAVKWLMQKAVGG